MPSAGKAFRPKGSDQGRGAPLCRVSYSARDTSHMLFPASAVLARVCFPCAFLCGHRNLIVSPCSYSGVSKNHIRGLLNMWGRPLVARQLSAATSFPGKFFHRQTGTGEQCSPLQEFFDRLHTQGKYKAIPHNSKCRYGERGAAAAKPKAQIILDVLSSILATQMPCRTPSRSEALRSATAACGGSWRGDPPERCLSRKAGIMRCCLKSFLSCVVFYR